MQNSTIDIFKREGGGKAEARRCRREGFIPGVAYHKGENSLAIKVPYKEFVSVAEKARKSQVFFFKSETGELNGKSAIVKEIQRDFISNRLTHIDFQTLKENEEIQVDVPLVFTGEAPGVKTDGGILSIATHEVSVRCLPKHIPDTITVDISALGLGESIHGEALVLPEGVVLVDAADETIVSVVSPKAAEETTTAAPAEGEAAAEGAAEATPAADAKGKKD